MRWIVLAAVGVTGIEASAAAQEPVLIRSEQVPITPLAGARVPAGGAQALSAAVFTGNLALPSGNVAGFGAVLGAMNSGEFDYVVVGAPDADSVSGRAFVYKKANTSATFDPPVELIGLGGRFGASVAIRWGTIAVGAPNAGRVLTFSQPRDSNGFPDETQNFVPDARPPSPQFTDTAWGTAVAMSFGMDDPMLACGQSHCETFYEAPLLGDLPQVEWNQIGPAYLIDNGAESEIKALAGHGTDGTIKVFNGMASTGYRSYDFTPDAVLGLPAGIASFTKGIAGTYDYFLVGGVPVPPGADSRIYSVSGGPTSGWSMSTLPIANPTDRLVGTTIANNTDTWLLSNTNAAGTGIAVGAVYRLKVNRSGTFYNYTDDTWSVERLATGGDRFGAALAMTPDFFVIGDPSMPQVSAIGNDQQLVRNMYMSAPSGIVTVQLTVVQGSPPPTITEDPTCSAVPGAVFQASTPRDPAST
jgi:hypothetical protein